jgi:hypothetical protein
MKENPYQAPSSIAGTEEQQTLRMYGITPPSGPPPEGPIRSSLTKGNIIGQWIAFLMFGVGPILLGVLLLIVVPVLAVRLGVGGFFVFLGLVLGFLIGHDVNEWVELDGDAFRWKHLFSRRVSERHVSEIDTIETLTLAIRTLAVRLAEGIFGRIKGFEFRFADRKQGVRILRADPAMTNVRELVEAVVNKMYQYGEVVPEIINFEGTPLIRRLTLKRR